MFCSCFLKLFLRIIFENIENNILAFSKIYYCYLNLVFSIFFRIKKGTKLVRRLLLVFLVFQNKKKNSF